MVMWSSIAEAKSKQMIRGIPDQSCEQGKWLVRYCMAILKGSIESYILSSDQLLYGEKL